VTAIKLIGDMNISPQTVTALQQQGWDIIRVLDVLPASASDVEILNFARQENRVIVTHDLDFSMLVALSGYNQPSLITLRLSSTDLNTVNQKLLEILPQIEQQLQAGSAITIEDTAVRIRQLPI
jgi:predicted nuclease of predicted toxin-antitoxin system